MAITVSLYFEIGRTLTGQFNVNNEICAGLWLWFPDLFNKLDLYYQTYPNRTVSVCDITDFVPPDSVADCKPGSEVFLDS